MISAIIIARDEEERLLRTLAALAPFAARGIVADVVVADLGSRDATLAVAEAAGCAIVENCADRPSALRAAVAMARKPWLISLRPGDLPGEAMAAAAHAHLVEAELSGRRRPAAFLAPAGMGRLRRALAAGLFDLAGFSPSAARRVLVPREATAALLAVRSVWGGVRLRARIDTMAVRRR
jgi:hypothetical protein